MRQAFLGILCLALSGCHGIKPPEGLHESRIQPRLGTSRWDQKFNNVGKLFGNVAVISSLPRRPPQSPIKKEIWQASLYLLKDFSFERMDPDGGLLETPWILTKNLCEQYKICLHISQEDHWVQAISLKVFHQTLCQGQWRDEPQRTKLAFYLKDRIITEARKQYLAKLRALPPKGYKNPVLQNK